MKHNRQPASQPGLLESTAAAVVYLSQQSRLKQSEHGPFRPW